MGIVFEARQRRLDRRVAIKILRPELATAIAAERFLAEGRILARLSHPNIVPIYDAGEADGLLYYVMEFVEGETLADRLQRGPLPPEEAIRLGRDLSGALGAAHALGIVHRDVKPANIFLRQGQALLGDFGIARWQQEHDAGLTTPGQLIGTPRYMSPEQRDGIPVTMQTDVYAAGLVVWEACTGQRWPTYQAPEAADWRRVRGPLSGPLRRALALIPSERWPDARALSAALASPRVTRRGPLVAAAIGATAILAVLLLRPSRGPATELLLEIASMETTSGPGAAAFGDSVVRELVSSLQGYADLAVLDARGLRATAGSVRLDGTVQTFADSSIKLELGPSGSSHGTERARVRGKASSWQSLVRSLADSMVALVWTGRVAAEKFPPAHALPKSGRGLALFQHAERFYAQGAWDSAEVAYGIAEQADPTCLICTYRLLDIERWTSGAQDSSRLDAIAAQIDSFPRHYQALIRAQREPWPARYDRLKAAVAQAREFSLASFVLGDELFHRGPLHGLRRRDALVPMQQTVDLRPDFAPAWEHLAWIRLGEGDSSGAKVALDRVPPERAGAGLSRVLRLMLQLGFQWRFMPPELAVAASDQALADATVERDYRTPAGGRMMMTVDAPQGAVGLGRALERRTGRPEAVRNGLIAQAHGWAALGRPDSLRAVSTRLRREGYDSLALYALELEAALVVFDRELVPPDSSLGKALEVFLERGTAPELQRRASWMLALLAHRRGDAASAVRFRERLAAPGSAQLRSGLDAFGALLRGDSVATRRLLGPLPPSDLTRLSDTPLSDAVIRLLRSMYAEKDSGRRIAANQLRWHEHLQLIGFPTESPQPGEVAWALSTLIRWQRAVLLDQVPPDAELCSLYAAVARLWKDGITIYRVRADSAKSRFDAGGCAGLR